MTHTGLLGQFGTVESREIDQAEHWVHWAYRAQERAWGNPRHNLGGAKSPVQTDIEGRDMSTRGANCEAAKQAV
jgi:hypothetical protein